MFHKIILLVLNEAIKQIINFVVQLTIKRK